MGKLRKAFREPRSLMPSMSFSCSGRPARIYGLYKLQPLPRLQPNWTPSTFALCGGEQPINTVFGPVHDTHTIHTILQLPGVVQDQRSSLHATHRNSDLVCQSVMSVRSARSIVRGLPATGAPSNSGPRLKLAAARYVQGMSISA